MSDKWVIDNDYPAGHLVAMTPSEQAQRDADQVAGAAASVIAEMTRTNRDALSVAVSARMATLRQARSALAGGSIFAAFSVNEKKAIDALLQNDLQFGRLILELFDATDA